MLYLTIKIMLTSVIVVMVSEIAKQSSFIGSILASVPLVSVLAMLWLYLDTKEVSKDIDSCIKYSENILSAFKEISRIS